MSKFQGYQLPPAGVNRVILSGAQWPQTSAEVSEARDFRMGSCVTSVAGPHGIAQLYER
jgi:hypothetical protein